MQRGLRVIALQGAIEKSPIFLITYKEFFSIYWFKVIILPTIAIAIVVTLFCSSEKISYFLPLRTTTIAVAIVGIAITIRLAIHKRSYGYGFYSVLLLIQLSIGTAITIEKKIKEHLSFKEW